MIAWGRCGQVERMGGGSWWKPSSRRELRWRAESARGLRRLEVVTGFGRSGCGDRVGAPPRPPPLQPTSALGSRDFLPAGGGPGCGQCCEDFYQASCLLRTWGASSTERGGDRLGVRGQATPGNFVASGQRTLRRLRRAQISVLPVICAG